MPDPRQPLVAEVRAVKGRLTARHEDDAEALLRDAMRHQNRSCRKIVTLAKRPGSPAAEVQMEIVCEMDVKA